MPTTRIADLKPNTNASFDATIASLSPPRQVSTSRGPGRVADAELKDDSGSITLSLWDKDIEAFQAGQKIRITDGWVKTGYQGKLQVARGHSGKIETLP